MSLVILSAFDRIRAEMAGCDACLAKPVDRWRLAEVAAQYVPLLSIPAFSLRSRVNA